MVYRTIVTSMLLATSLCFLASCSKTPDETPNVQAAWNEYKAAILAKDGPSAVARVDQATINYYGELQRLVLNAGQGEIASRSMIDRMMIALIRAQMDLDYIAQLTPDQLFMVAVQEGMIGESTVQNTSLGEIEVTGNTASAPVIVNDQSTPNRFEFTMEDEFWKLNLLELIEAAEAPLRQLANANGMSQDELLLAIVGQTVGQEIDERIWDAPRR